MLRLFHKYQRSLVVSLIMVLLCLGMIGFGVEFIRSPEERAAITVGEIKISDAQFDRARENYQDRLRAQFGKQYAEAMKALRINVEQQTIDQLIAQTLISKSAKELGLAGGTEALQSEIKQRVGGSYSRAAYQTLLRQVGMSSDQYEAEVRDELAQRLLITLLTDFSQPSRYEIERSLELKGKRYTVNYLEIDPEKVKSRVATPSEEELQKYYSENPADYTIPPRASYDFLIFRSTDFENSIEPTDDEIETYLENHREDYSVPEQAKVRHIQINFPESSDPAQMSATRETALKALERAQAGDDFGALALEYSNDLTSKITGGGLGWVKAGTYGDDFDKVVFGSADTGVLELVESDSGFHIVSVDERIERGLKPVAEVRDEIVAAIRTREAPAHASERANSLLDQWLGSNTPLAEFAKTKQLNIATATDLTASSDPATELAGLSKAVLDFPEDDRRVIELDNVSVLVQIKEFKEPQVSPFNEVKVIVAENYKITKGRALAKELAQSVLDQFKNGGETDLKNAAQIVGLTTTEVGDISRATPPKPPLSDQDFRLAIFGVSKPMSAPLKVIESNNKYYLVQVTKITSEKPAELDKEIIEARSTENQRLAYILVTSLLNSLKAQETIDVAPNLYADNAS